MAWALLASCRQGAHQVLLPPPPPPCQGEGGRLGRQPDPELPWLQQGQQVVAQSQHTAPIQLLGSGGGRDFTAPQLQRALPGPLYASTVHDLGQQQRPALAGQTPARGVERPDSTVHSTSRDPEGRPGTLVPSRHASRPVVALDPAGVADVHRLLVGVSDQLQQLDTLSLAQLCALTQRLRSSAGHSSSRKVTGASHQQAQREEEAKHLVRLLATEAAAEMRRRVAAADSLESGSHLMRVLQAEGVAEYVLPFIRRSR